MKGEVTSVSEHHGSRNHVVVHVAHGKRKPKPRPKKGQVDHGGDYDDRPQSSIMVHKKDAAKYGIGRRVHVAASLLEGDPDGDGDETGEDLDGMQKRLRKAERR